MEKMEQEKAKTSEKTRKGFGFALILINGIMAAGLLFFLFTKRDLSAQQREEARLIGACYMTMNNPYYEIVNEEIRAVVEENGDVLVTRNPALDSEKQVEQIQELIDMGVSAIFVTPVDWIAICPVLEQAREKGIRIIAVDADIYEEELADCTVVSDNYMAGVLCAAHLMGSCDSARIVLLEHSRAKSSLDRMAGFEDTLAGSDWYQIVARGECDGQLEVAMPVMEEVIRTGVEYDTVFALNDPSALGCMAAMEDAGVLDGVRVYGVDGAPEAKAMILEGMMTATSAQFPAEIGRKAAENMYRLLNGEACEARISVPVCLITGENVREYEIGRWQ